MIRDSVRNKVDWSGSAAAVAMRLLLCFAACFAACFAGAAVAASDDEFIAILREAENARGDLGKQGITWIVDVESEERGENKSLKMRVIHQSGNVLAEILEPEQSRGSRYLVTGTKMYYHKPGLSRPVSISRRQRVMGNAAIGDVAATSYLQDYKVESVEEGSHEGEACYVFLMKENSSSASYPRLRYWVSKDRHVGVKTEFYAASGTKLRTATMKYDSKLNIDGRIRDFISEMVVQEDLGTSKEAKLSFGGYQLERFPEEKFEVDSLVPGK